MGSKRAQRLGILVWDGLAAQLSISLQAWQSGVFNVCVGAVGAPFLGRDSERFCMSLPRHWAWREAGFGSSLLGCSALIPGSSSGQSSLSSVLSYVTSFHMFPRLVPGDVKDASGPCSHVHCTCLSESCWSALLVNPLQEATSDQGTPEALSSLQFARAAEPAPENAPGGWATSLVETSAADPRCPLPSPSLSVLVNQVLIADQALPFHLIFRANGSATIDLS